MYCAVPMQFSATGKRHIPTSCVHSERERERERDRQTDRQTERQTERETETETDRQTETQRQRQVDRQTDRDRQILPRQRLMTNVKQESSKLVVLENFNESKFVAHKGFVKTCPDVCPGQPFVSRTSGRYGEIRH